MVRIGIVGLGFMGMIHYLAARQLRGAAVTAICSRDPKKLAGDWRGIRGNFGPLGQLVELGDTKRYSSVADLIADPNVDLVDICLPTALHPSAGIAALNAGKHVLIEKAIALTLADADDLVNAARAQQRLLMVAHVLPFFPEFKFAVAAVQGNRFGRLVGGHFKRVISKPTWSDDVGDPAKTGGPAVDLHIHDTHLIGLLCGKPTEVISTGVVSDGTVQYLATQYRYGASGPALSCSSGAIAQAGRPFVHGFELYFEQATVVYESGTTPLTVFPAAGGVELPALTEGNETSAFTAELQTAVDAVASGIEAPLLSGQLARDALLLCQLECESVRSGRPVMVP